MEYSISPNNLPYDSLTEILVRLPVKSLLRFRSVSKDWYSLIAIPYVEILLRLPVKSLLRFKSVCKNWCALISSSCFITKHLHHKKNPARLLIPLYRQDVNTIIYELPEKTLPGVIPILEKSSHLQIPAKLDKIIGPVDGIFFLYKFWYRMALWNPATREFKLLPLDFFMNFTDYPPGRFHHVFGFGFDPLSHDYKVVCICFVYDEEDMSNTRVWFAAVYSLSNDCWRNLTCNFDPAEPLMLESTCMNGFCYWSTKCKKAPVIRYFDLHNEVFGEIPGPDHRWFYLGSSCYLTIYRESICLLVRHLDHPDQTNHPAVCPPIEAWQMNDEREWVKVLNVMPTRIELLKAVPQVFNCWPLGLWGDDKFFFICRRDIVFYDSKTHEFTRLLDAKEEGLCEGSTLSYRESLVSIQAKNVCHCDRQGDIFNVFQEYFEDWEDV